jgi:hypothetical protein
MLEQLGTLGAAVVPTASAAQPTGDLRVSLPSIENTSASGRWINIGNIQHFGRTPEEQVAACFQTVRGKHICVFRIQC